MKGEKKSLVPSYLTLLLINIIVLLSYSGYRMVSIICSLKKTLITRLLRDQKYPFLRYHSILLKKFLSIPIELKVFSSTTCFLGGCSGVHL